MKLGKVHFSVCICNKALIVLLFHINKFFYFFERKKPKLSKTGFNLKIFEWDIMGVKSTIPLDKYLSANFADHT